MSNQEEIKKQIEEFQHRKSQELLDRRQRMYDLESSMLSSVMIKPQRNDRALYLSQLKSQMQEENSKKSNEKFALKDKY